MAYKAPPLIADKVQTRKKPQVKKRYVISTVIFHDMAAAKDKVAGWMEAGDLRPGTLIYEVTGKAYEVEAVPKLYRVKEKKL